MTNRILIVLTAGWLFAGSTVLTGCDGDEPDAIAPVAPFDPVEQGDEPGERPTEEGLVVGGGAEPPAIRDEPAAE